MEKMSEMDKMLITSLSVDNFDDFFFFSEGFCWQMRDDVDLYEGRG